MTTPFTASLRLLFTGVLACFFALGGGWAQGQSADFRAIAGPGVLRAISTNCCIDAAKPGSSTPAWITNLTATRSNGQMVVTFSIDGGVDGAAYDVFSAPSLDKTLTNVTWMWLGQGYCKCAYQVTIIGDKPTFLLLGSPLDSDNDGLTDAYEALVSHSDPHVANSINAAMLDGWSVLWRINPVASYDQSDYPDAPLVRLDRWEFNTNTLISDAGLLPAQAVAVSLAPDWSGSALVVTNLSSWLNYPLNGTNGPEFDPSNGTLRFWFMPFLPPGPTNGTTFFATLFNFGGGANAWTLYMVNNQLLLGLAGSSPPDYGSFFLPQSYVLNSQSNIWYQFTITYSPTNLAVYTNGSLYITSYLPSTSNGVPAFDLGDGMLYQATSASQAAGFSFGNNNYFNASVPANGLMDEFETFNYPLSPQAVSAGFPGFPGATANILLDSDYDGRSDLLEELVDGTNPRNPNSVVPCRLGYWRFNSDIWLSEQGQLPLSANAVTRAPSWSGTALNIGPDPASQLTYWDVFTNGWANINCRQGTLRFWFKPNWNVAPAAAAPLVYLGNQNPTASQWSLNVDANGSLIFSAVSNHMGGPLLTSGPLAFDSGHWTQIALTYGPSGSKLYTNGILAATGLPVTNWPNLADRNLGLVIGNSTAYTNSINGQFEEMETFNYQLAPADILSNFQVVNSVDSDLNGVADLREDVSLVAPRPFLGRPVVITGAMEAEQFDLGGPGVGYQSIGGNPTNSYRPTQLFITNCDDIGLGYCLDQTRAGEWVQYTIQVLIAQNYSVEARVEGIGTNGVFECEFTNHGFYTNTGPMVITSTSWTNVAAPVWLTNGTYTMRLRFLTNGSDNAHVGRFNYISIYPWWPAGFSSSFTNTVTASQLSTNNDWSDAANNAAVIQNAVNSLPSSGGTVLLPAGRYYVSQSSPNESLDSYLNAAVSVVGNNIEIAGAGKTNTTLVSYNRATTIFTFGDGPTRHEACTNLTLRDLTVEGQPHLAVHNVTNTVFEAGELVGHPYTGYLTTFKGVDLSRQSDNVLVSNCQFLHTDFSIGLLYYVSNCIVTHCNFIPWEGSNVFNNATNAAPTNTMATAGAAGFVGIFVSGAPSFNLVIVDNDYEGNKSLAPAPNNPYGYANTTQSQLVAPDGFIYFQSGGNFYIARNIIRNYDLEGVQLSTGPSAVVGNQYQTLANLGGTCALALNVSGFSTVVSGLPASLSTCFIGNSVHGGHVGESPQGINSNPVHSLVFSGNDVWLYPSEPGDYPGAAAILNNCSYFTATGNLLRAGGHGVAFGAQCGQTLIMNNDFSQASYRGISLGQYRGEVQGAQVLNNRIGEGSTFHVQFPYDTTFNWFLYGNTYLDRAGNSIPPFFDPLNPGAHVSN